MTTIVFAHPYHQSFNKFILDSIVEVEKDVCVIDLNKDNFNPVLEESDLALYSKGKSNDENVNRYIEILDKTTKIIFIFPIWWYDMPAILRGFFDKVMLKNSAFTEENDGLIPIRDIKKTLVITTSAATTDDLINKFNDPINKTIINSTFKCLGFNNAKWLNLDNIYNRNNTEFQEFILKVQNSL